MARQSCGDAKEYTHRIRGGRLSCDVSWGSARGDLSRRGRFCLLSGYAGRNVRAEGVPDSCLCVDGESLSPLAGDAGAQSCGGDEMVSRDLYAALQPATSRKRALVPRPVQGHSGGSGGRRILQGAERLHPPQSGPGRVAEGHNRPLGGLSMEQLPLFRAKSRIAGVAGEGSGVREL